MAVPPPREPVWRPPQSARLRSPPPPPLHPGVTTVEDPMPILAGAMVVTVTMVMVTTRPALGVTTSAGSPMAMTAALTPPRIGMPTDNAARYCIGCGFLGLEAAV